MRLFLLYEQVSSLEVTSINELLEKRNSLYNSMKTLSSISDNQNLYSLCNDFRVKMETGDHKKKPEKISKTTTMPIHTEIPKSTNEVLTELMNEIAKVQDIELRIKLME